MLLGSVLVDLVTGGALDKRGLILVCLSVPVVPKLDLLRGGRGDRSIEASDRSRRLLSFGTFYSLRFRMLRL